MDLKKIMALAMLALMVIPSLTIAVGADTDDPDDGVELAEGEDLASAIARARLYLGKVRDSAEATAEQYEDPDHVIHGYLSELNDLLGEAWEDGPDFLLEAGAVRSEDKSHRGAYSVHLKTTGTPGEGDEARIVITMPDGFTLGDLKTLSWWEYLVTGYPPHVDVFLAMGDSLNFEYAYNDVAQRYPGAGMPYGALVDDWFKTFSDDGKGPAKINDDALAWPNSGPPGAPGDAGFYLKTLAEWKAGVTYDTGSGSMTINADSIVTKLEIEVDNWVVQTEAYVDDIKINTVTYDFEEEHEARGAEAFLDQAEDYLAEGDNKSAARCLASARNILGRVKGLLNSMAKAHKVTRAEKFERKFDRRIQGLKDKIERQKGPKK